MHLATELKVDNQTEAESERHYILKLNKSLYGLKQASFNWYGKLKTALVNQGFKPSDIDQCLYIGDGMIILTYINGCIIVVP